MHLVLNFRQKPYIGFVLIPDKNQLWITDVKNMVRKEMVQNINQISLTIKSSRNDFSHKQKSWK